jgi:hypothetical protein
MDAYSTFKQRVNRFVDGDIDWLWIGYIRC